MEEEKNWRANQFLFLLQLKLYPRILNLGCCGVVEDLVWFAVFREFPIGGKNDARDWPLARRSHLMVTIIMVIPCLAKSFITFSTSPTISGSGQKLVPSKEHDIWLHGETTRNGHPLHLRYLTSYQERHQLCQPVNLSKSSIANSLASSRLMRLCSKGANMMFSMTLI